MLFMEGYNYDLTMLDSYRLPYLDRCLRHDDTLTSVLFSLMFVITCCIYTTAVSDPRYQDRIQFVISCRHGKYQLDR